MWLISSVGVYTTTPSRRNPIVGICESTFDAGLTEDQCKLLAGGAEEVTLQFIPKGECVHIHGDDRSRCTGRARREAKAEMIENGTSPSQLVGKNLGKMSDSQFAANNSKGAPTTSAQVYSINKEILSDLKVSPSL